MKQINTLLEQKKCCSCIDQFCFVNQIYKQHAKSYRDLPAMMYQINLKFRDEIRPRFGVMRGREFLMKDAYSFDTDAEAAKATYMRQFEAYMKTFARMGMVALPVKADTGPIGGDLSHEFQSPAETGESEIFYDAAIDEMTKLFMEFIPKAGMYGATNQLDYTPGSLYTKWDEETKEAEFYIGLLVHSTDKLPASEGMTIMEGPKGKIVKISKFGQYGVGDMEAHAKIAEFMGKHNLVQSGPVWELYENDPMEVKPADIQTDIYYLVTDAKQIYITKKSLESRVWNQYAWFQTLSSVTHNLYK